MQIMQDRSEYDLMTNFVKFMQQTSSPLSEDDSSVCNCYLLQFTYLINSSKVKASVKTSIFSRPINASLQMFMPFTGMSFINDFLLQPMLHFNHPLQLVAWLSGRTSVFGRRTFSVLRSTCSRRVTTYVGKPYAMGQPTRPTQPFIPSGSIDE